VSFYIGFVDGVRVGRFEMMREGIPKKSMSKLREARAMLIRGWRGDSGRQSEADAMAYMDVVKMTSIEDQRCGVNGGQE